MQENNTNIAPKCAIVHNGQMIQAEHLDALLELDSITDLEMLEELTDDCLTIASEVQDLINPSFFKNMRWIVTHLRDLKRLPIQPLKADRTIEQVEAELAELKKQGGSSGHA